MGDATRTWSRRTLIAGGLGAAASIAPFPLRAEIQSALSVRAPQFGAIGDGISDDTQAFEEWLDALEHSGRPGHVPAGVYKLPRLRRRIVSRRLEIFGEGRDITRLIAGNASAEHWLCLNASLHITGLAFEGFRNVVVICDETKPRQYALNGPERFPATLTRALDGVTILDCGFRRCRRPLLGFISKAHTLSSVSVERCHITESWSGIYLDGPRLRKVFVSDNVIENIDGSAAGHTQNGNPIRAGSGRAIHIGHDGAEFQQASGGYVIAGNRIRGVTDQRRPGPQENPEVNAVSVMGCSGFAIRDNHIENVSSAVDDDCEGVYVKALNGRIENNTFVNAGGNEATLALKGRLREWRRGDEGRPSALGGHITVLGNTFRSDKSDASAALIAVTDVTFQHNQIDGYRRENASFGIVTVSTPGPFRNIQLTDNEIRNSACRAAIVVRSAGENYEISRNRIYDVQPHENGRSEHVSAIRIDNRNKLGPAIRGVVMTDNVISGLSNTKEKSLYAVQVNSNGAPIDDVVISNTRVSGGVKDFVRLSGPFQNLVASGALEGAAGEVQGEPPPNYLEQQWAGLRARRNGRTHLVLPPQFDLEPGGEFEFSMAKPPMASETPLSVRVRGLDLSVLSGTGRAWRFKLRNNSSYRVLYIDNKWSVLPPS